MSPAPLSNRLTAIALLLIALLVLAAVRGSGTSAYGLVPFDRQADAPSILVTAADDVHSGPGSEYLSLALVQPGDQFTLLGRSTDGRWWRIDCDGQPAWLPTASARAHAAALVGTVTVVSTN